jgi:tetratricopeptide (TPR) repeat protein
MAPISLTFDLPAKIAEGLVNGEYIRNGGVIQDTAGRVVTWLKDNPETVSNTVQSASSLDPSGALRLAVQAADTVATQQRLGAISAQVSQLQNLVVFSSAASLLTLGVTAIGFTVIYKKIQSLEKRLKAVQVKLERIDEKIDIAFYSNFRAALDLAQNAFTMRDKANRRSSALQAIDRFLEAEHIYLDLTDKELERRSQIGDEYLLTLCLAFIAETRCYLELGEYETAISRFEEGKAKINQLIAKYLEMLLTPNPIIYLHPKLKDKIDLARLTRIYQWRDPGMTESAVFDQFRKSLGQKWTSNFWSDNVPKSIIGNDEIDNFFGITTDKGLSTIFSRLPQAVEAMEMMIETARRFESYEYEVKFLAKNNISFSKWSGISPKVENKDNSPLFFITHAEPMAV